MTNTLLHIFKDDLLKRPLPGFMSGTPLPPRVILAKDLDDNNKALTLIDGEDDPPAYRVKYTKDGTVLTDIQGLPPNAIAKEFDICENGSPASYWFVVWNEEPQLPGAAAE